MRCLLNHETRDDQGRPNLSSLICSHTDYMDQIFEKVRRRNLMAGGALVQIGGPAVEALSAILSLFEREAPR